MTAARRRSDRSTRSIPTARGLARAALVLLAAAAVACGDAPTTPGAPGAAARGPALAATTTVADTTVTVFRVGPADSRMIVIGAHKLDIPPGAICELATAGYGPGTWDAPCAPEAGDVTFTARAWVDPTGHPRIAFSPDVRFAPDRVVTLSVKDPEGALTPGASIGWCPSSGGSCVNEALADPSLATRVESSGNFLVRRVKHFSGYNVIAE